MTTAVTILLAGILVSSHFALRSQTHARDATEKLWTAYLAQARARRLSGRVGQRFESLEAIRAAARIRPAPELRDEAIACMGPFGLRLESRRTLGSAQRVGFGPNLQRYAEVNGRSLTIRRVADASEVLGFFGPGHWWGAPRFSADGRLLAQMFLSDDAAECQVWDIDRGELTLKVPVSRTAKVAAFCPDRCSIAVIGPLGNIQRYDLKTGDLLQSVSTPGNPSRLAPHRDGRRFAVMEQLPIGEQTHTTIQILDLIEGDVVQSFTQPDGALAVSWHPDGKHVTVLCQDFTIRLWDAESGQHRSVLQGHQAEVVGLVFQPGRNLLATTSWDGTVRICNPLRGNQLLWAFEAFPIRFSVDGRRFCSCRPGVAKIWEVASPACRTLHEFSAAYKGPWYVDFSLDGRLLASAGDDGVHLWHVPTGREIAFLPVGQCQTAIFCSSGQSLIASGAFGVQQWPIVADRHANVLRIGPPETIVGPTETGLPRLSLQGDCFARIMEPGNVATGNLRQLADLTYCSHQSVAYVALSPDARWVATGTWGGRGVRVWDARDGTLVKELVPESHRTQVGFSPDGRWLVAGTEREYRFWEVGSWKAGHRIAREPTDLPGPIAFTRDGRILAIALTRYVIQLTDAVSGEKLAKLEAPDPVHLAWLCFSPDGSQLAVKLWDLIEHRKQAVLKGHEAPLNDVCFAPDGKTLATVDLGRTIKLWEATGKELATLKGHKDWIFAVAFAPDGMSLATAGTDQIVKLWDMATTTHLAKPTVAASF